MFDWIGDAGWWDTELLSTCQDNMAVGHYDDAIREAFIIVEERIRELANLQGAGRQEHGRGLVFYALNNTKTDFALRLSRRGVDLESARSFIGGIFGLIRNPIMHNLMGHNRDTCVTVLRAANLILRFIEQGRASVEDLWYTIRHPTEAIAPNVAFQELVKKLPAVSVLQELLLLRAESAESIELIDACLPPYLKTLQKQSKAKVEEMLLQMLEEEDTDIEVRKGVAYYLQFFPSKRVDKALCEVLHQASEQPEELTVAVIDTLAILKTAAGRRVIAELPGRDLSPGVKAAAVEALGQMGYQRYVVDALIGVLEKEERRIRKKAIVALRKIGAGKRALPALHHCLTDGEWDIQIEACETLGAFGEPESAQPLGELLLSARAEDVRRAAAKALGQIRTGESFAYLDQCQRSENEKPDDKQDKVLLKIIAEAQQNNKN